MQIYYVDPADLVQNLEAYRRSTPVKVNDREGWHEELPVDDWVNPDATMVSAAKAQLKSVGQTEPCVMRMVAYEGHLLCIPDEANDDYSWSTPMFIHAAHELRWPTIMVAF